MNTQLQNPATALLDDEFYEQEKSPLARAFRRFDDSQLTRYAWVAGDDIPVCDRSGGRFWGLFPDEVIRKRRLMPIRHARTLSINEYPALIGTAEQVNAPGYLAPIEAEGFERSNSMRLVRPPKTIAYEIMGEYEDTAYGPAIFEHPQLMGDDKKDLILRLYRAVVPRIAFADPDEGSKARAGVSTLRPITRRGVLLLGDVTATFLDQWRDYLTTYAAENVRRSNLSRAKPRSAEGTDTPLSEYELALYMLDRMQEACARAWHNQSEYLASSRDGISSHAHGGKGKRWYDARDERYLLETGIVPINLEEVAAAQRSASVAQETILAGFEKIADRMGVTVSPADIASQVQTAVNREIGALLENMPTEQLMEILRRKEERAVGAVEAGYEDTEERRARNAAERRAASAEAPQSPDDAAQDEEATTEAAALVIEDESVEPLDDLDNEDAATE